MDSEAHEQITEDLFRRIRRNMQVVLGRVEPGEAEELVAAVQAQLDEWRNNEQAN